MIKAISQFFNAFALVSVRSGLFVSAGLVLCLGLSGCSDFKRAIGKEKSKPDEFEVVVRPPLSLPPNFSARPTDQNSSQSAASAPTANAQASKLFARRQGSSTNIDTLFAFDQIEENIRTKIDEETKGVIYERRLPLQVIFGGLPDVGPIVDKMAEDERIRQNRRAQRAINEGATPAIDQVLGDPVLVQ